MPLLLTRVDMHVEADRPAPMLVPFREMGIVPNPRREEELEKCVSY
jgi:hypothetical protein